MKKLLTLFFVLALSVVFVPVTSASESANVQQRRYNQTRNRQERRERRSDRRESRRDRREDRRDNRRYERNRRDNTYYNQNRRYNNRRYNSRVRTYYRTRLVRRGYAVYRETYRIMYLPNGRNITRLVSRVRVR